MSTPAGGARVDDRGESLVELLVSIAILGIAVVAILGALTMNSTASSVQRDQAQGQNVLRNWAESVSNAAYTRCATPASFASTLPTAELAKTQYQGRYTADVQKVMHWRESPAGSGSYKFVSLGSCTASGDLGLQKVTLRLTVTDPTAAAYTPTLDVVVRNACATTTDPGC